MRADGRDAVTHVGSSNASAPIPRCWRSLRTGRTHQIRVHLAHIGHPVVGDPVYGNRRRYPVAASEELRATLDGFGRQALHAAQLALQHPVTGAALSWEAPLPADMQALIGALATDQRTHARAAASHVRGRR